jgi:tetratricopeptide (TPR) repeat protein
MPTRSSEAYILHLRGFGLLERHDPASVREAMSLYEKAVGLDSSFALAQFYLGVTHFVLWSSGADHTPARRAQADEHFQRAVDLGPDLPEIRTYQGWNAMERGDLSEALDRFDWLRSHHPNREDGWWGLALVRQRQGRFEEAMAAQRKFLELNPRASGGYDQLARSAWFLRRYQDARDAVERGLAVAPDDIWLISTKAGIMGTLGGSPDSARRVLEDAIARIGITRLATELSGIGRFVSTETARRLLGFPPDSFALDAPNYYSLKAELARGAGDQDAARVYSDSVIRLLAPMVRTGDADAETRLRLAMAYATVGRKGDALREVETIAAMKPVEKDGLEGPLYATGLASVRELTGDLEGAIAQLERLLAIPSPISVPGLRADPRWRAIRSHPRFTRLIGDLSAQS